MLETEEFILHEIHSTHSVLVSFNTEQYCTKGTHETTLSGLDQKVEFCLKVRRDTLLWDTSL